MAIGLYIIGARGNVATLAAAGWAALVHGAWDQPTGLVTALPEFADAGLPGLAEFAFGGCDVSVVPLAEKAAALADAQMLPARVVSDVAERLAQISAHIDRVEPLGAGKGTLAARLNHYCKLLDAFRARERVSRVIVINLASTEPSLNASAPHLTGGADGFLAALESAAEPSIAGHPVAGNGMLWAAAAFISNCAFVNFTPSQGSEVPAIAALADARHLPHAGKDGKTGETLLKTVLGPMFVARNLRVMSWLANNYLGNDDGRVLSDPAARATKLTSKDEALRGILGAGPHLSTDIGYAPSLGDWKTAWDLIHFEGFMGARMTMQFTWQGCDSALASPLVLDLARLTTAAWDRGESGALHWLAPFFKSPMGASDHAFAAQMAALHAHIASWR